MLVHFVIDARIGGEVVLASRRVLLLDLCVVWVQFHNQFAQVGLCVM
jgi:hypothetical protein